MFYSTCQKNKSKHLFIILDENVPVSCEFVDFSSVFYPEISHCSPSKYELKQPGISAALSIVMHAWCLDQLERRSKGREFSQFTYFPSPGD